MAKYTLSIHKNFKSFISMGFFLNLEKRRGAQNTIKKVIIDDTEITDRTCILNHIKDFYEALFKKPEHKTTAEIRDFLNVIDVPKSSEDQVKLCEEDLTKKDLYKSLRSMQNNKSPGNDGLTKEFYKTFWDDLKEIFVNFVGKAKEIRHLITSQRQAIIKLIEKKYRDKRFMKNWRPISLLNVDSEIISKALSEKLKEVLPDLIPS